MNTLSLRAAAQEDKCGWRPVVVVGLYGEFVAFPVFLVCETEETAQQLAENLVNDLRDDPEAIRQAITAMGGSPALERPFDVAWVMN